MIELGPYRRLMVDGIVSQAWHGDYNLFPMITLKRDYNKYGPSETGRQRWDDPPTETELDWWVRDGDEDDGLLM